MSKMITEREMLWMGEPVELLKPLSLAAQLRPILAGDVDEATLATALVAIKPAVYIDALIDRLIDRLEVEPMAPERSAAVKAKLLAAIEDDYAMMLAVAG
jgi:hypothetical protein